MSICCGKSSPREAGRSWSLANIHSVRDTDGRRIGTAFPWQIMFIGGYDIKQNITPTLMFTDKQWEKAEDAINFYVSVFRDSEVRDILRYRKGEEPDRVRTIKHASFRLEGVEFPAMDSARVHDFAFNLTSRIK